MICQTRPNCDETCFGWFRQQRCLHFDSISDSKAFVKHTKSLPFQNDRIFSQTYLTQEWLSVNENRVLFCADFFQEPLFVSRTTLNNTARKSVTVVSASNKYPYRRPGNLPLTHFLFTGKNRHEIPGILAVFLVLMFTRHQG